MPRYKLRYPQQTDPEAMAQRQAASQAVQQRQAQASAYAAARFNEWAAGAKDREALMNARLQQAQASAEMAGAQFRYNLWKDNELRAQTTHYYNAMPAFQQTLKQLDIKPGTERYRAEMAAFASTIPDALTHNEAIRKELSDFAKVDATQEQINSRLNTVIGALNQAGQRPTSFSTTATGGVDVKATRPMDDSLKALNLTPSQFLNHVNAKQGKIDEQGKFTNKLGSGEQASYIQFQAGESKDPKNPGAIVTHNIPLSQFNEIRSSLGKEPIPAYAAPGGTQSPSPSPTPTATPDQTPVPSPTPIAADQQQPAIRRYNPDTGELE